MNAIRVATVVGGLVFLGYPLAIAVPAPPADENDSGNESIVVRSARIQVALAEANLKRVQSINQRVPNTVSQEAVADYERELETANRQLQRVTSGSNESSFDLWLDRAQAAAKYSETAWRDAVAANQRLPGTMSPIDVERLRLRHELDQLDVDQGRAVAHASPEAKLEWQMNLSNQEVERLKHEVRRRSAGGYSN